MFSRKQAALMFDRYTETVLTNIGINIIMTLSVYLPLAVGQLSIAQVGFMAIGAHLATVLTLYLHVPFGLALVAGVGGGLYAHFALYIQYSDFGADRAMAILTYAVFGGIDVWFGGVLGA